MLKVDGYAKGTHLSLQLFLYLMHYKLFNTNTNVFNQMFFNIQRFAILFFVFFCCFFVVFFFVVVFFVYLMQAFV